MLCISAIRGGLDHHGHTWKQFQRSLITTPLYVMGWPEERWATHNSRDTQANFLVSQWPVCFCVQ